MTIFPNAVLDIFFSLFSIHQQQKLSNRSFDLTSFQLEKREGTSSEKQGKNAKERTNQSGEKEEQRHRCVVWDLRKVKGKFVR